MPRWTYRREPARQTWPALLKIARMDQSTALSRAASSKTMLAPLPPRSRLTGTRLAAAEEVVRPFLPRWPKMDRPAIVQGWAGVYSSFLLHAERAAERYGVPTHEILQRAGELGYVGGQEDMIIDIAVGLAQERDLAATGAR